MKKLRIFATCLLIVCTVLTLFACKPNPANSNRQINAVNHRGYNGVAPENTLAAFRLSKEMGFDMVECDVRFTKDNKAVLLHDGTVNRTSNGKGNVDDLTLEEVRELDFGSWKDASKYAGEKIPTFEEFVALCVEIELYPYVEVKSGATFEQMETLVEAVANAGLAVTWISFDKNVLSWLADARSGDRFGLLTNLVDRDDLMFLSDLAKNVEVFIDVNHVSLTPMEINSCKSHGIPLEVWTVNSQTIIESLDEYVTGVTSDNLNAQEIFNNM